MNSSPHINDDVVIACMDLVGRAGASGFEIGYLHDDVSVEEAGWYAHAQYQGARIMVQDHRSPTGAALALAERLLRDATCRCRRPVTLSDGQPGCRWRLVGRRWEPGCDAPPITVKGGERGDHAAIVRAMQQQPMNRAQRRAAKRKGTADAAQPDRGVRTPAPGRRYRFPVAGNAADGRTEPVGRSGTPPARPRPHRKAL